MLSLQERNSNTNLAFCVLNLVLALMRFVGGFDLQMRWCKKVIISGMSLHKRPLQMGLMLLDAPTLLDVLDVQ